MILTEVLNFFMDNYPLFGIAIALGIALKTLVNRSSHQVDMTLPVEEMGFRKPIVEVAFDRFKQIDDQIKTLETSIDHLQEELTTIRKNQSNFNERLNTLSKLLEKDNNSL